MVNFLKKKYSKFGSLTQSIKLTKLDVDSEGETAKPKLWN